MIDVEHLHKSYGSLTILRGLSLHVPEGQVYGLLGPQGAGKSTLIHILLGFLRPQSGSVRLFGMHDLERARRYVGYVPEPASYHMRYSAHEYMMMMGRFSDLGGAPLRQRVDELLHQVRLHDAASQRLATFSRGMLQRLGLALALLSEPVLLLLDDPLSGSESEEQRELGDLLLSLRGRGHTMLICSSYVASLANVCDRVGVLAEGRLADETSTRTLRATSTNIKIQVDQLTPALRTHLSSLAAGVECGEQSVKLRPNSQQLQVRVLRTLLDSGVSILSLEPLEHPLEQFYVQAIQAIQNHPQMPIQAGLDSAAVPSLPSSSLAQQTQAPPPTPAPQEPPAAPAAPAISEPLDQDDTPPDPLLGSLLMRSQPQKDTQTEPSDKAVHDEGGTR